jgi:hypothetical protein
MKQTVVEWLYDTIDNELIDFLESRIDVNELSVAMLKAKEQAKAMEKQQTMDFALKYMMQSKPIVDYYNETYGGDE